MKFGDWACWYDVFAYWNSTFIYRRPSDFKYPGELKGFIIMRVNLICTFGKQWKKVSNKKHAFVN